MIALKFFDGVGVRLPALPSSLATEFSRFRLQRLAICAAAFDRLSRRELRYTCSRVKASTSSTTYIMSLLSHGCARQSDRVARWRMSTVKQRETKSRASSEIAAHASPSIGST